jgi:hypothetical protein
MALIQIDWRPDRSRLRTFGGIASLVALAVGARTGYLIPWATVAGLLLVLTLAAPTLLRPLYVGLTLLTFPLGLVVSELILVILFFGVVTPLGWLMRLRGWDPMERKFERGAQTYWKPRTGKVEMKRYFRQY